MYIGEIAKETGLSIKTIRFYEARGIIMAPARKGQYRIYNQTHVELFHLIREAKQLGATLSQIKQAIVYKDGAVDWGNIAIFLVQMREQLKQQVEVLNNNIQKINKCITDIEQTTRMK